MSDSAINQPPGQDPRQPHRGSVVPGATEPPVAAPPAEVEAKDIELQEQTATSSHDGLAAAQDTVSQPTTPSLFRRAVDVVTWVPKALRHDPENPPAFGIGLNLLYAIVSEHPSSEVEERPSDSF